MSQYKISKKRLAQIIKEEYQSLQELEDPRSPSPMSWEYEGAADDFRKQIMNLVLQLGPLTLEPKLANAVEIEIRDVLNTLGIGTDPRSRMDAANRRDELDESYLDKYDREHDEYQRERKRQHDRERKAHSRYQSSGRYKAPGYGSGGIGGGGSGKKRFAGFNRKDEAAKPDYIDLDKDGDKKEPMKKAAKDKKMKKESMDSIRALIQKELKNL